MKNTEFNRLAQMYYTESLNRAKSDVLHWIQKNKTGQYDHELKQARQRVLYFGNLIKKAESMFNIDKILAAKKDKDKAASDKCGGNCDKCSCPNKGKSKDSSNEKEQ